jgi:hypothetical protein
MDEPKLTKIIDFETYPNQMLTPVMQNACRSVLIYINKIPTYLHIKKTVYTFTSAYLFPLHPSKTPDTLINASQVIIFSFILVKTSN